MTSTLKRNRPHIVRAHPSFGLRTGTTENGRPAIVAKLEDRAAIAVFGDRGKLEESRVVDGDDPTVESVIAHPCSIKVAGFAADGFPLAILDLPSTYEAFLEAASDFDVSERAHFAVLINEWRQRHHYVIRCNDREYWCDEDGHVMSRQRLA